MTKSGKIGMGLVGPGFIAAHHLDAVRRLGDVEIIGIAGSSPEAAKKKAKQLGVPRAYDSVEEMFADAAIDVVHNTTPNYLHFPVSMAALRAGKHVVSDKPLAMNGKECRALTEAAEASGLVNAVTFNYRGNPLIQQARAMIAGGELGQVVFVHGQYLQDWMTSDRVYSWRSDPAKGGVSSALADIGSHWCDLAEHLCGSKIVAVLTEMTTVVSTRYLVEGSSEAFTSAKEGALRPTESRGEDLASTLLRFDNGAKGSFSVGQVLPGHKNDLRVEINGRSASIAWEQEKQNELWMGFDEEANRVLSKDPQLLYPGARAYAHLPAGHQEGWADAFRNVIADIYTWVRSGAETAPPATVATFSDASHGVDVLEAMLVSYAVGGVWTDVRRGGTK